MSCFPRIWRVFLFLLVLAAAAFAQTSDEFTIIALPDTQHYSRAYPHVFNQQTQWIVNNAARLNIKFVLGLGDIVNNGDQVYQWQNADAAVRLLDNARLPYVLALGNHDYMYSKPSTRDVTLYNRYFGPSRYAGYSWYRGNYPSGSNENFYAVFSVNGRNYLVIALETFPRDAALSWASSILAANRDKDAIIVTHAYIYLDDSRIGRCDSNTAASFGVGADNDGDEMWAKFVSKHPNIVMVLNGHTHGVGRRADIAANGNLVNQMLSDYQDEANGGNGWLRILRVRPSLNEVEVQTYSPFLNQYRTDSRNQFKLKYKGTGVGTSGDIAGRVRDTSCKLLPGVTVAAGGAAAQTDSQGKYSVAVRAPATYTATASKSGYSAGSQTASVSPGYATLTDFFLSASAPCALNSASPSVTICTPGDGASVSSPVRIVAGTTSSSAVTTMKIYLDGTAVYTVKSDRIDTGIAMAAGKRRVTAQAWNSGGQVFKQTVYVNVTSGSTSQSGSLCTMSSVSPSVTICTPTDGATVSSPVRLIAGTTSSSAVNLIQVYLDGAKVYELAAAKLDTSLAMAGGTRRLTVQARNTSGVWFKKTIYITVQ